MDQCRDRGKWRKKSGVKTKSVDFGYAFCRVCRFYGLSDEAILKMPIGRFWEMHSNIDRIRADETNLNLTASNFAFNGGDKAVDFSRSLKERAGTVFIVEEAPIDRAVVDNFFASLR
jgi:hypothetical protein